MVRLSPTTADEIARLAVIDELAFSSVPLEPSLQDLVELASTLFDTPMAAVNIVQAQDVSLLASVGMPRPLDEALLRRDVSFCAHTIAQKTPLIVADAEKDPRFRSNPLVTGPPNFRFYAGVCLRSCDDQALGALCIIDDRPRSGLGAHEVEALNAIADQVAERLDLRRTHIAHRASPDRFERMLAGSPLAVFSVNERLQITMWNRRAGEMFGYSAADVCGRDVSALFGPQQYSRLKELLRFVADQPDAFPTGHTIELTAGRRDGGCFPVEASVSVWHDREQGPEFAIVLRDLTEIRLKEAEIFRVALTDPLTGLPNRVKLKERLDRAVTGEHAAGLILLGIDAFSRLNGALGDELADEILIAVARRLAECAGPEDFIARTGAGEFALCLDGSGDPIRLAFVADTLFELFSRPFYLQDQALHISVSAGIAVLPGHGSAAAELLANAGLALEQAQQEGGGNRRLFTWPLRAAAVARRGQEADLRQAIDNDQLELFYQAQVDLRSQRLIGAEALLRWRHPERGLIAPDAFLPAVEGSRMAVRLGRWILETACRQMAVWHSGSRADLRVGVNLFAAQFRANDLVRDVDEIIRETALPPEALELEITENIILAQDDVVIPVLTRLRERGVHLAFDDFGTGYASLSLLKHYPLTRLKIDRSFVKHLCEQPEDEAVIDAILHLGRRFGLEVIAEGIETPAQRNALARLGCLQGQGYLFGRPLPAAEFHVRHFSDRSEIQRKKS